jgi:hypothetical protein
VAIFGAGGHRMVTCSRGSGYSLRLGASRTTETDQA